MSEQGCAGGDAGTQYRAMTGLSTLKEGKKKSHVTPGFQLKPCFAAALGLLSTGRRERGAGATWGWRWLLSTQPCGQGTLHAAWASPEPGAHPAVPQGCLSSGPPPRSPGGLLVQVTAWRCSPMGAPCSAQPTFAPYPPPLLAQGPQGTHSVLLPLPQPRGARRKPGGS